MVSAASRDSMSTSSATRTPHTWQRYIRHGRPSLSPAAAAVPSVSRRRERYSSGVVGRKALDRLTLPRFRLALRQDRGTVDGRERRRELLVLLRPLLLFLHHLLIFSLCHGKRGSCTGDGSDGGGPPGAVSPGDGAAAPDGMEDGRRLRDKSEGATVSIRTQSPNARPPAHAHFPPAHAHFPAPSFFFCDWAASRQNCGGGETVIACTPKPSQNLLDDAVRARLVLGARRRAEPRRSQPRA